MRTKLQNDCFALEAQPSRVEQVFLRYQGQRFLLGDLIYHFKYWQQAGASSFHQVFLPTLRWNCRQAIREGKIADKGFCRLVYDLSSENRLQVCCSFTADREVTIGFYCWGLKPPENVTGLRLLPGVYSGYTLRPGLTALFRFAYSESKGPGQAALAVDQTRCWFGTTRTAYQYLCLSFPPAYKDGVFRVHRGETVTGKLLISQARPDIWNPVFKEEEYASEEKLEFLPPRYPYSLYLDYFSTFARQPSLWVPLGKGMGLYHVGYYGHLTRVKRGGPYGYACQGRPLRYRQLAEWLEKKRPGLSHFQENTRQLEIAWGNGTNAMVAYALLLLGKPWSVSRGREIVQAILRFGFLISRGPLSGAWWGAYNVDRKRFQDHYGGQQLFLPDQGLVNHFLARAALDGFVPVSLVQEAIERNVNFLERLERKFGWFPNAVSSDGQIGYSREGVLYRQPVAPGIALVAQSLVMLARLSGEKKFLRTAERIIQQHLLPLFARNDFGCLEYDHAGHDSSGACLLLVSLAEYLNCPGARLREEISYWQERIFWHLMSFRHEYDFFPYLHSFNAVGWGGVSVNKFGFLHGFTPGSSQGEYALHLRYDYGYGLWKTGETNPVLPAYPALVNYLNHLTYHQFINPKLKKGFGGLTEHVAMRTYVQDTTHILHSTPLPMILLLRRSREEKRFWEPLGGYEARS